MKSSAIFFTTMLTLLFCGCEKEEKPETNLSGKWIGLGYQCPIGTFQNEEIEIFHSGDEITATKITGDPCVPAGLQTFEGTWNNDSQSASITWTTGNPPTPGCCTASGSLEYSECTLYGNSTSGEIITFTRIDGNRAVNYDVPNGVPLVAQPDSFTCWAASMTMMLMWRDNTNYSIVDALSTIDNYWVNKFNQPSGISDADFTLITNGVGLKPRLFIPSIEAMEIILEENGPLWVGLDANIGPVVAQHVLIVTGIHGDGSPECTYLNINDPSPVGTGSKYVESYSSFLEKVKQVMGSSNVIPIHHW